MLDLPFSDSQNAPSVRRPAFALNFGGGDGGNGGLSGVAAAAAGAAGLGGAATDPWAETVVSLSVEMGLAPTVDFATIHLANESRAPVVAPGDSGMVMLGYDDSENQLVFTGVVDVVRHHLLGMTRITAVNGSTKLARWRVNQSYQQQAAGKIVNDLIAGADVAGDTIEDGGEYPFFVIEGRQNVWDCIGRLARHNYYLAYVTPEDKVYFGPPPAATADHQFSYANDLISLTLRDAAPVVGNVTMTGAGAAGGSGAEAWSWPVKDPSSVQRAAGSEGPARYETDGAWRSGEAVETAAAAAQGRHEQAGSTGHLLVPGAPAVTVGSVIEISDVPQEALNGSYLVHHLRHQYHKFSGFTTQITFSQMAEGGLDLLGAVGGLL